MPRRLVLALSSYKLTNVNPTGGQHDFQPQRATVAAAIESKFQPTTSE